jgi:phosphoribosyl 1,2-cyclic phosphate phosphodiesterase
MKPTKTLYRTRCGSILFVIQGFTPGDGNSRDGALSFMSRSISLTFLGTSSARRSPRMGCFCPQCSEARRHRPLRRLRASVLLRGGRESLLIDPGPDHGLQMRGYREQRPEFRGLTGILLTHLHFDHVAGLFDTTHLRRPAATPIWAPDDQHGRLKAAFWPRIGKPGSRRRYVLHGMQPEEPVEIGPFTIRAYCTFHTSSHSTVAYRVEAGGKALLYAPDMADLPQTALRDVDRALVDAAFWSRSTKGHAPVTQTVKRCLAAGVREVWLTHVGHYGLTRDQLRARARRLGPVRVAEDGSEIVWNVPAAAPARPDFEGAARHKEDSCALSGISLKAARSIR